MKYYRVKQDNFLWKEGAILSDQDQGKYMPIEDVWDVILGQQEYISAKIIEHPDNAAFFERVYTNTLAGKLYQTKDQIIAAYKKSFS